ncbi:hypothetical protein D8674_039151 [Pyrus ussuriensis x Pyrus communis]|uniref:Uncharacterized protein n=1 Tax=Pyrus ussuriensis x Pyrus communis TaxID=2448454 RepID=A0A5N5G8U6_9ROSA|nr:hypothetical protein D8674_039151 [Pyrus ussuriensis x Pyrus communis]
MYGESLTKLEIQLSQIVKALNEHQFGGDDQEKDEEQLKEACCAYFHSKVPKLYEDEEPYIPPRPYVPPILFPGRFVKQKHDKPPIDVFEEILPVHHKKEDSELDDDIAALNEFHSSLATTHSSIEIIAPATSSTIFEDLFFYKERRKHHHNQVLKPLIPTNVRRYLDFLPP